MNKAVFLDRDGVVNKNREDYVKSINELEIIEGVFSAIKKINENYFKVIVISNQSAINRKKTTKYHIERIHEKISTNCIENNCNIDAFYFCPHTPKENCSCRKPKPGLLVKAAKEHNIDLSSSWLIGDKDTDIIAGQTAGCKTIKIRTDGKLEEAVNRILGL